MTNIEFRNILTAAVAGEHYALEIILEQYSPLINRYSVIDGKLDEDLRQYILMHIALNISKFSIQRRAALVRGLLDFLRKFYKTD